MASQPLYIILSSGEHEKVHLAAMIASVAAVSDRKVEVFVTMNAVNVFERGLAPEERYHGGNYHDLFVANKVPDTLELFQMGKDLGELKMWVCSMVLDLKHWEVEKNLTEGLFDGAAGLTVFLSDAENGQLLSF